MRRFFVLFQILITDNINWYKKDKQRNALSRWWKIYKLNIAIVFIRCWQWAYLEADAQTWLFGAQDSCVKRGRIETSNARSFENPKKLSIVEINFRCWLLDCCDGWIIFSAGCPCAFAGKNHHCQIKLSQSLTLGLHLWKRSTRI